MDKINKLLAVVALVVCFTIAGYAGTRNNFMVPVNQTGAADSFALPCTPKYVPVVAANAAVAPLLALDEAGMVYWVSFQAVTAADYVVLRDTATANTTSTPILQAGVLAVTDNKILRFDPPMYVANGLSVNVSSGTMNATVCIREADGDL